MSIQYACSAYAYVKYLKTLLFVFAYVVKVNAQEGRLNLHGTVM